MPKWLAVLLFSTGLCMPTLGAPLNLAGPGDPNRFYEMSIPHYRGASTMSLFADADFVAREGDVSVRSTDQSEEKPNG